MKKLPLILKFIAISTALAVITGCGSSSSIKRDAAFSPEKWFADADKQLSDKYYDEARELLTEVKNRDASKKHAPIAQLKIADTYIKEGNIDIAIEEYRRFIEQYPENQYASYAQYQIAMAYFSQIESPDRGAGVAQKALREFMILKQRFPRNPYREIVDLRIDRTKNTIAEGELMIGQFYYKKDAFSAAIGRLENLLQIFPEFRRADEAMFLIAESYRGLKQQEKAKEMYAELLRKYPESKFVKEAKKRL
ncbi:MAG: outer membrane protein assembly factor BamD [Dissulfurispiraceae bacterium]|jgi:outer membrane protein assembly factor BamD|nr:outer membrane protein assembly factor BamD [Dissulfurispiraceae bacterium]